MLPLSALTLHLLRRIIWCSNLILFLCKKQSIYHSDSCKKSLKRKTWTDLMEDLPADLYWIAFSWALSMPARSLFSSWRMLMSTSAQADTASNTVNRIWNMAVALTVPVWVLLLTEWSVPSQSYIIPAGSPHTSPPHPPLHQRQPGSTGQHFKLLTTTTTFRDLRGGGGGASFY